MTKRPHESTFVALAAMLLATACCTSRQNAAIITAELRAENLARSEPAMRGAARRLHAELLPDAPGPFRYRRHCESSIAPAIVGEKNCILWYSPDGRAFRFLDAKGTVHLVVRLDSEWAYLPRLARRGDTLFLLLPRVSRRKVGERTQCECDGGQTIVDPEAGFGFVIPDAPVRRVEVVEVPVTEDYIHWECKTILV